MKNKLTLIPIEVSLIAGKPQVRWCLIKDFCPTEAFYMFSLRRASEGNNHWEFTTGIDELLKESSVVADRPVESIIYHMGRCGSTLLVKSLQTLEKSLVISEFTAIEDLIILESQGFVTDSAPYLRALINIYVSVVSIPCEKIFIKTTLLPTFYLDKMRSAFPEAQEIFIIRNPIEVISSFIENPPPWLLVKGFLYQRYFDLSESGQQQIDDNFVVFPERLISEMVNIFEQEFKKDKKKFTTYDLICARKGFIYERLGLSGNNPALDNIYRTYSKDYQKTRPYIKKEGSAFFLLNLQQAIRLKSHFINFNERFDFES